MNVPRSAGPRATGRPAEQLLLDAEQRFVLESLREERIKTAIAITQRIDSQRGCHKALAPFEPNMPLT